MANRRKAKSWKDVSYGLRQVWGACAKVPVETCRKCPYFMPMPGGNTNIHGQPGTCCFCRAEAQDYKMTGAALCE